MSAEKLRLDNAEQTSPITAQNGNVYASKINGLPAHDLTPDIRFSLQECPPQQRLRELLIRVNAHDQRAGVRSDGNWSHPSFRLS